MGGEADVLKCLLNVKFPLSSPHCGSIFYGCICVPVYILKSPGKEVSSSATQIILNLKYIPQNFSKELFIHSFN